MPRRACFPRTSALLLAVVLTPAGAIAQCLASGAVYELAATEASAVTLRLGPAPFSGPGGDLMVELVRHDTPLLQLQPIPAMGHGGVQLFPLTDPDSADAPDLNPAEAESGLPVLALSAGADGRLYPLSQGFPQPAEAAPEAIVVAGLAATLWYATNGGADPVSIADGIWYRAGCGGTATPSP